MSDREELVEFIHARNEFDHDQCDHGLYAGGAQHGQPYAMCERMADAILASAWFKRVTSVTSAAGRLLTGSQPG